MVTPSRSPPWDEYSYPGWEDDWEKFQSDDDSSLASFAIRSRMEANQILFERNLRTIRELRLSYPGWLRDREEAGILLHTSRSGSTLGFHTKIRAMKSADKHWWEQSRMNGADGGALLGESPSSLEALVSEARMERVNQYHGATPHQRNSLAQDGQRDHDSQDAFTGSSSQNRSYCLAQRCREILERATQKRVSEEDTPGEFGNCVVCLEGYRKFAVTPCGHLCLCKRCARRVMSSQHSKCPICNAHAKSMIRIYLA